MASREERMAWYSNYLKSPHWARTRDETVELLGHECEVCGVTDDERTLHVHHLNYDHLWKEQVFDLIVLCNYCHRDAHQFPYRLEHLRRFAQGIRVRRFGKDYREVAV